MNIFVGIAEILVDPDTHDVGIRFDSSGTTYVLPRKAAESVGRSLVDASTSRRPRATTPAKARWTPSAQTSSPAARR